MQHGNIFPLKKLRKSSHTFTLSWLPVMLSQKLQRSWSRMLIKPICMDSQLAGGLMGIVYGRSCKLLFFLIPYALQKKKLTLQSNCNSWYCLQWGVFSHTTAWLQAAGHCLSAGWSGYEYLSSDWLHCHFVHRHSLTAHPWCSGNETWNWSD